MPQEPYYKSHWREIDEDRMSAYRDGFAWDAATDALYEPARLDPGHVVADFGCGPGKVAVALAEKVGADGHVHALDINPDFLGLVRKHAADAGIAQRITTHLNDGVALPLDDAVCDRVTARNTLMYVDDPVSTLSEFHRILRPGGLAHAIDGDWFMMVAEPVEHDLWRAFVKAAAHACRHADMGRKLYARFARAGFHDIDVAITAVPDTTGRLLGMIRNMGKYARESGSISDDTISNVVEQMEQALNDGTYFVVSPQYVVTGRRSG